MRKPEESGFHFVWTWGKQNIVLRVCSLSAFTSLVLDGCSRRAFVWEPFQLGTESLIV